MNLSAGIQATRDHFAKRAPVEPDTIRASRSYAGHGPKLVFDKLSNTWWGPGIAQSGQGEWIEVGFTLDPATGPQRRSFRVGEVTRVRFTIDSAPAASARKQVAIAEIELFGRSDSSRT